MDDDSAIPPTQPSGDLTPPPRWPPTAVAAATPGPEPDRSEREVRRTAERGRRVLRTVEEFGGRIVREFHRRRRKSVRP